MSKRQKQFVKPSDRWVEGPKHQTLFKESSPKVWEIWNDGVYYNTLHVREMSQVQREHLDIALANEKSKKAKRKTEKKLGLPAPHIERWIEGPPDYGTRFCHLGGEYWQIWRDGAHFDTIHENQMCDADRQALAWGKAQEAEQLARTQDKMRETTLASVGLSATDTEEPAAYHEKQEILAALKTLGQFAYDSNKEVVIVSQTAGYKFGHDAGYSRTDMGRSKIYTADWDFTHYAPHDPNADAKPTPDAVQWYEIEQNKLLIKRASVQTKHGTVEVSIGEPSQSPLADYKPTTEFRFTYQGHRYRVERDQIIMLQDTAVRWAHGFADAIVEGSVEVAEEY